MSHPSKLYIMLKPPLPALQRVRGCRSAHGFDDSYPPDRLHSTLLRLGDGAVWSAAAIDRLIAVLANFWFEPFAVAFDQVEGRLLRGRRGMNGAALFHRALRSLLSVYGIELPVYNFWLHLSLAYKGIALAAPRKIDPIGWLVEDFRLIRSVEGIGHEELGRWPLLQRQLALL